MGIKYYISNIKTPNIKKLKMIQNLKLKGKE
jgi:hypothetical protein